MTWRAREIQHGRVWEYHGRPHDDKMLEDHRDEIYRRRNIEETVAALVLIAAIAGFVATVWLCVRNWSWLTQ